MGIQRDGTDDAVICYFGDGATSQGDVSESFVFASVFNAPVVFFCQNNQWAISAPLERQTQIPLYQRAAGFGFPGVRVDGNDVLAVLAVTKAALATARGRATARCWSRRSRTGWARTPPPTTPPATGSPPSSRPGSSRTRSSGSGSTSARNGLADHDFFDAVEAEAEALAVELRAGCRALPDPDIDSIFEHVYAEPHPLVAEERAQAAAYHASFHEHDVAVGGGR